MAPGGGICKEVCESRSAFADYDVTTANLELRSSPFRKATTGVGGKHGMPSTSGVHELLECPVCMDLMHPPIHQVCCHISWKITERKLLDIVIFLKNLYLFIL